MFVEVSIPTHNGPSEYCFKPPDCLNLCGSNSCNEKAVQFQSSGFGAYLKKCNRGELGHLT